MLEERVRRLEKKRLVSPVTTRHSTGKRYPRSPRRDATERKKAELNPWTLSGAASAQADRPRTARHKTARGARAYAPKRGIARQKHQLPSSRRHRRPGPPQRADTSCPSNKQTKRRAPRGTPLTGVLSRLPTGVLSHPPGPRSGAPTKCMTLTEHVKREIAELPFGRIHQLDQSLGGYCRVPQLGTP